MSDVALMQKHWPHAEGAATKASATTKLPATLEAPATTKAPATTGAHLLSTRDVTVRYDLTKCALQPTSLDFDKDQVTALIGPSGCGKSTFLRCLNLMNREIPRCCVDGQIYYHGHNINTKEENLFDLRASIGMVFQQPAPFRKSIRENIIFAPKRHGRISSRSAADELVETSLRQAALWDEVKDKLDHSAWALSGGQQQRLCIARALATNPDVLLMDEPTSALDPLSTAVIEELVVDLARDHTVVIVTHNMQQAARVADKTAFFYLGELIEAGPTRELFASPQEKRTQQYLSGRFS